MSKFFKALEQAQRDRQAPRQPTAPIASANHASPAPGVGSVPGRTGPAQTEMPQGVDEHLVSLLAPAAFEAEQYRSLRLTVEQMRKTAGLQVIGVTSAAVGDGKTTTAINLAGALAQSPEARVLVVEADLRRPSVGQLLGPGHPQGPGLVSAIMDPAIGLEQIVHDRPPFNLALIHPGGTPPSPYEVLRSPRLGELLDEARKRFDYIIVDAPPLVPMQDCRVIGRWVDGFLLVVQAHRTPRRLLEESLTVIDPAKMIGLVFNGDTRTLSGYYSGYYGGYGASAVAATNGLGGSRLRRAMQKAGASLRRPGRSR